MINSPLLVVWYVWRKSFIGYCWGIAEVRHSTIYESTNAGMLRPQLNVNN